MKFPVNQDSRPPEPPPIIRPDGWPDTLTAYQPPRGLLRVLLEELALVDARCLHVDERLVLTAGTEQPVYFVHNIWRRCRVHAISSIGEAATLLRSLGRNWSLTSIASHRRAALIRDRLPRYLRRPLVPLSPLPRLPMHSFTLLTPDRMLVSVDCTSPFPEGEILLCEDHEGPPCRAYLKLWELFTAHGLAPRPGDRCLDLGGAPGGWTWALQRLGCQVRSVDRAPLSPAVARLPGVTATVGNAFALDPRQVGPVDWLFSDLVCYPRRLLDLVTRWLDSGLCRNLVCTLKFQGPTDHATARAFAALPGSRLVHLNHNRHELTWFCLEADRSGASALVSSETPGQAPPALPTSEAHTPGSSQNTINIQK